MQLHQRNILETYEKSARRRESTWIESLQSDTRANDMSKSKKEPSLYPLHGQMSRIDWKPRTKHTKLSIFKSCKLSFCLESRPEKDLERPGTAPFWYKVAPFCGGLLQRYKGNMLEFRTAKKFWNGRRFAKREWRMHCCQKQLTMNEIGLNLCLASSYKYIIKFKIFEKFSINS